MKTYPLQSISIEEAYEKQFKLVDAITRNFTGTESLTRGDLGVHQPENEPITTMKAEKAIASFFDADKAILVRGSGTGAIRYALSSVIKANETILVHDAPIYSTTLTSFEMLGLNIVRANFNDLEDIKRVISDNPEIKACLVQTTRQAIEDKYDLEEVIQIIKSIQDIPIVVDDNYAVMKVKKIGVECGADLSCFSSFKLQGPEGIGIVVGKEEYVNRIRKMHYSGGCQTQGHEALDVLRGLTYAPVMLAITAKEVEKTLSKLQNGEIPEIKDAFIANAQSKVLLVELSEPIAKKVLENANLLGALPNPVGAESKYELAPMFYKVSGTFLKKDPTLIDTMLRINCNRASSETVLRILKEAIKASKE